MGEGSDEYEKQVAEDEQSRSQDEINTSHSRSQQLSVTVAAVALKCMQLALAHEI